MTSYLDPYSGPDEIPLLTGDALREEIAHYKRTADQQGVPYDPEWDRWLQEDREGGVIDPRYERVGVVLAGDANQPRDSHGRWTSGGVAPSGHNPFGAPIGTYDPDAYKQAKTVAEVATVLHRQIMARGDVEGFRASDWTRGVMPAELDLQATRETLARVGELMDRFPGVKASVHLEPALMGTRTGASTEAVFIPGDGPGDKYSIEAREVGHFEELTVKINPDILQPRAVTDRVLRESAASGQFHTTPAGLASTSLGEYAVTHEFGHLLDRTAGNSLLGTPAVDNAYKIASPWDTGSGPAAPGEDEGSNRPRTSKYGASARPEAIAEGFADVETNGDGAYEFSKVIHQGLLNSMSDAAVDAAEPAARVPATLFGDADQPRDDHGRWSSTGHSRGGVDPKIATARTTAELGAALQAHMPVTTTVGGFNNPRLDLERTRRLVTRAAELYDQNPHVEADFLIEPLDSLRIGRMGTTQGAINMRDPRGPLRFVSIRMNSEMLGDPRGLLGSRRTIAAYEDEYKRAVDSGWFHVPDPSRTDMLDYSVTHEFGHAINNSNRRRLEGPAVATLVGPKGTVSGYGEQGGSGEVVAEAFADVQINGRSRALPAHVRVSDALLAGTPTPPPTLFGDADQPRDDHGRWATTGGTGGPAPSAGAKHIYSNGVLGPDNQEAYWQARYGHDQIAAKQEAMKRTAAAMSHVPVEDCMALTDSLLGSHDAAHYARFKADGQRIGLHPEAGIIKTLTGPVAGTPEADQLMRERMTRVVIGNWARTSSDSDPHAIALQLAAAEAFHLHDYAPLPQATEADLVYAHGINDVHGETMQEFHKAQAKVTQDQLRADGVKTIVGYRGVGSMPMVTGKNRTAVLRPLSSFSTDIETAKNFAVGNVDLGNYGVMRATFPVESIVGSPGTGQGALPEREVVVKGGTVKVNTMSGATLSRLMGGKSWTAPLTGPEFDAIRNGLE